MSSDAWPNPDSPPAALPRIEDLPIAEPGYDQEAVRLAFDSFYRHAAQLDASLRALEAVEVFRRDADALRNDLRALRALGLGGGIQGEPAWATKSYERATPEIPGVVVRLAAETALLVAVAVVAGVAQFRGWVIVLLMALAFVVVAISEWFAARARFVPPAVAFLPPLDDAGEPAPYVEAPAPPWGAAAAIEPAEETEPDALTMIEPAPADDEAAPAVDPWEHAAVDDDEPEDAEPEDAEPEDAEPEDAELVERGSIFRRRRR
jgi:hypothetical protein